MLEPWGRGSIVGERNLRLEGAHDAEHVLGGQPVSAARELVVARAEAQGSLLARGRHLRYNSVFIV